MTPNKEEIGRRAAMEVAKKAAALNLSIGAEMDRIDLPYRDLFYRWIHGRAPNAIHLAQMAEAGYDVLYILTGKNTDANVVKESVHDSP